MKLTMSFMFPSSPSRAKVVYEEDMIKILTKIFIPKLLDIEPIYKPFGYYPEGYNLTIECNFISSGDILDRLEKALNEKDSRIDRLTSFHVEYSEEEQGKLRKLIVADEL